LRAQGLPTLPSSLAQERRFNPFLQALDPVWAQAMALHLEPLSGDEATALSVFTALRTLRNDFS
jgi:hydroxyacylglutathione hydrolase